MEPWSPRSPPRHAQYEMMDDKPTLLEEADESLPAWLSVIVSLCVTICGLLFSRWLCSVIIGEFPTNYLPSPHGL